MRATQFRRGQAFVFAVDHDSADGRMSHLLAAEVQFIAELVVVEIATPTLTRPRLASLYDVPLLTFDEQS